MTSADVRTNLVRALGLDLIGPDRGDADLHAEVLATAPSRWYLTGFLVPTDADPAERSDDSGDDDEVDQQTKRGGMDDNTAPDRAARRTFFQSSMGMSLLVPKEAKELQVTASRISGNSLIIVVTSSSVGTTMAFAAIARRASSIV